MWFIAVYDEDEKRIGWLDEKLNLVDDRQHAAGFSSHDTADEVRTTVEHENPDWYTELEE